MTDLVKAFIEEFSDRARFTDDFAFVFDGKGWQAWFGGHNHVAIGEYIDFQSDGWLPTPEEALENLRKKLND